MKIRIAFLAALAAVSFPAAAQELSVGLSTPVTTMDPHFHNLTPNNSLAKHLFETLVHQDDQQALRPGLAESWKALDDTTWEIKLRKNVRWHDGAPFTAEDVLATLKRIPNVPNSPASFAIYTRPISDARAKDPHTLILTTRAPHLFSGDRVVLVANDKYWGPKPAFPKIRFRMITNSPARVAALLAGDAQMIEAVPTADIANLKKDARVTLASTVSNRIIYLHMDSGRERNSPFVTDTAGRPLEANPLRDPRVRKAISMMIDRNAIVSRIMEGEAKPAGQFLPETFHGTSRKLQPEKYDPDGAKKLLAAAGYPNGFGLTLHTPNNRYINDENRRRKDRAGGGAIPHPRRHPDQGGRHALGGVLLARLEAGVLVPARRLGCGHRREQLAAALAGGQLRSQAGQWRGQPRPLFGRGRGRHDPHRALHHRRHQARSDAGSRGGQGDRRADRRHPAALRSEHLGHEEGPCLQGAGGPGHVCP